MNAVYQVLVITCVCLSLVSCSPAHGGGGTIDDSPQAKQVFLLADKNNDTFLYYSEFGQVFSDFDINDDGNVTYAEFRELWMADQLGPEEESLILFTNLDVNKDFVIEHDIDMPYIFKFFDRDADLKITEGEFVIQWVKIST